MPNKPTDPGDGTKVPTNAVSASAPAGGGNEVFAQQIASELQQTESEIRSLSAGSKSHESSIQIARQLVQQLQPVPQFIWRISSYALGRPGKVNKLSDGNLFGLKKLVLAIAKDRILGKGGNVVNTRGVLDSVGSDVIAAVAVIHALGRRLQTKEFQAVWGPILDDALMRAQMGYFVGTMCEEFGPGRAMLAGFAGRIGLAVLIATGNADQAQAAITLLAGGRQIDDVALELYGCEPLHIAAMILSAAGCGRDAVLGVASFTMPSRELQQLNAEQRRWLAALTLTERVRAGLQDQVEESMWLQMGYEVAEERFELVEIVNTLKRRGHGWNWIV